MRPIWIALSVFVGTFLVRFATDILIAGIFIGRRPDVPLEQVFRSLPYFLTAATVGSILVIAAACAAAGRPRRARLGLVAPRVPLPAVLAMVAGALALGYAMESLALTFGLLRGTTIESFAGMMAGISGLDLVMALAVVGVLAPMSEELFFRGFIQTRLLQRWHPVLAVVVAALAFGIVHLDWVHGALAFGYGLYFGFLTVAMRSVLPAMLSHVVNNLTAVLLASSGISLGNSRGMHVGMLVGTTALFILSLEVLRRLLRPQPPGEV